MVVIATLAFNGNGWLFLLQKLDCKVLRGVCVCGQKIGSV